MPLPPRATLAAWICPSTPFLLPRLLRVPIPSTVSHLHSPCSTARQRAQYATVKKHVARPKIRKHEARNDSRFAKRDHTQEEAGRIALLEKFLAATDARDVQTIMQLYPTVVEKFTLQRNDTRRIVTALHNYLRNMKFTTNKVSNVFPFVERVAQDIRSGILPPQVYANVHMLGIYKECKRYTEGAAFWEWLSDKDETYADQAVYGAAIELLAYGGTSLEELEELYSQGLKRFPGTFAEYHLSPDAIVPDRTQPTTISGLPMLLLQGILTARLLSRDWRRAYLALDTALRLYPAQLPPRFFELFILERPISEAYTVFLIACRSGIVFKPSHLTTMLSRLYKTMPNCDSLEDRMILLRGMGNAIYAYMESGGTLEGPHIGVFLNAHAHLLPEEQQPTTGDMALMRTSLALSAHKIVSMLLQAGLPPQPQPFIGLITLAGRLGVPSLLKVVLQDADTARLDLGEIGDRSVLLAAGAVKDTDIIENYWSRITSKAAKQGRQLIYQDWISLAKACGRAKHMEFFNEQLKEFFHTITGTIQSAAIDAFQSQKKQESAPTPVTLIAPASFESEIENIQQQMRDVTTIIMSGQPLDLRKTPFSMFLSPNRQPLAPMDHMRAIYDEVTIDPHQPPAVDGASEKVHLSSTGIPLGELRFQNWCTVMELMNEAENTEEYFQRRLDEAIAGGRPLDAVPFKISSSGNQQQPGDDSSDVPIVHSPVTIEELRTKIRNLRTPSRFQPMT